MILKFLVVLESTRQLHESLLEISNVINKCRLQTKRRNDGRGGGGGEGKGGIAYEGARGGDACRKILN